MTDSTYIRMIFGMVLFIFVVFAINFLDGFFKALGTP